MLKETHVQDSDDFYTPEFIVIRSICKVMCEIERYESANNLSNLPFMTMCSWCLIVFQFLCLATDYYHYYYYYN